MTRRELARQLQLLAKKSAPNDPHYVVGVLLLAMNDAQARGELSEKRWHEFS
jgi:hypothetical protein